MIKHNPDNNNSEICKSKIDEINNIFNEFNSTPKK